MCVEKGSRGESGVDECVVVTLYCLVVGGRFRLDKRIESAGLQKSG